MIRFISILLFLPISLLATDVAFPWIVYYGDSAPIEAFDPYNPIVFHSDSHPPIDPLLKKKKEVLGYLYFGEIDERSRWFSIAKEKNLLIKENPDWKGAWFTDLRNPLWKQLLFEQIIPDMIAQGFNGLLIDQVDVSIALEHQNPKKYAGMTQASVDLIAAMHKQFPNLKLMLNRGYELLPQVGDFIDYELAETLYTSYNFQTQQYYVRPKEEFRWQLSQLNDARFQFPHLVVFSLDYWNPDEKWMYRKIYTIEQKLCLRPFVSTIVLDRYESE